MEREESIRLMEAALRQSLMDLIPDILTWDPDKGSCFLKESYRLIVTVDFIKVDIKTIKLTLFQRFYQHQKLTMMAHVCLNEEGDCFIEHYWEHLPPNQSINDISMIHDELQQYQFVN